mmetsp:Transcript_95563/g.308236  ORF Transcript_95563/g.308236 Transcript_95563/m.308236 type:complete len:373 (-) Transcript_95563:673-1791(-)
MRSQTASPWECLWEAVHTQEPCRSTPRVRTALTLPWQRSLYGTRRFPTTTFGTPLLTSWRGWEGPSFTLATRASRAFSCAVGTTSPCGSGHATTAPSRARCRSAPAGPELAAVIPMAPVWTVTMFGAAPWSSPPSQNIGSARCSALVLARRTTRRQMPTALPARCSQAARATRHGSPVMELGRMATSVGPSTRSMEGGSTRRPSASCPPPAWTYPSPSRALERCRRVVLRALCCWVAAATPIGPAAWVLEWLWMMPARGAPPSAMILGASQSRLSARRCQAHRIGTRSPATGLTRLTMLPQSLSAEGQPSQDALAFPTAVPPVLVPWPTSTRARPSTRMVAMAYMRRRCASLCRARTSRCPSGLSLRLGVWR